MTRVLIVEDSPTQAAQLQALLQDGSYEVSVAGDGAAALNAVSEVKPDVVVTDMQMPVMNGLELVDRLRFQYSSIPVILITAHGSEDLAVEALQRGAAAYVPKSQVADTLADTIHQVLGLVRADRSLAGLLACLTRNEFTFLLQNDVSLIGPLGDLMQQVLSALQLGDVIERVRMGMAVEHALLNALYRGNLELTDEELQAERESLASGGKSLVAERAAQAPYCHRRIFFDARLNAEEARFVIRDAGSGFDTSIVPEPGDPDVLEREGGRGLLLMKSFMDEVVFNEKGNEVTLVKRKATR